MEENEQINLKKISTEQTNARSSIIDELDTAGILQVINEEDKLVALAVEQELPKITQAVDIIYTQIKNGGRLIYIGAGTSGRLGVLDASECPPTYGVNDDLIIGIIAGGDKALRKAQEGAEDSFTLATTDLKNINFNKNDVLVGIAASGRTPYVIGGLKYAKSLGAYTIGLCNSLTNKLEEFCHITIIPLVGPEVVTGSTRMKSGTSQKLVLNMLTTATMIKLGKTYGNLMVDVKASNAKLIERQINIVILVTQCSREQALETLKLANDNCKLAIFIILSGLDPLKAREVLEQNNGKLKKALRSL